MHYVVIFALLSAVGVAAAPSQDFSFSPPVGSGSGSSYSVTGEGRITAVRVWERYNSYIYGFQVRYGLIWSSHAGLNVGTSQDFELFEDEAIVQISGKYSHFIQSLVFVTNRGRFFHVGQASGNSFNMYALSPNAELRFLSGRYHGGITSIGAHWAVLHGDSFAAH